MYCHYFYVAAVSRYNMYRYNEYINTMLQSKSAAVVLSTTHGRVSLTIYRIVSKYYNTSKIVGSDRVYIYIEEIV